MRTGVASTSYPPPPASQPAMEGAQSGGRPWITLRPCSDSTAEMPRQNQPPAAENLTPLASSE